jgi:hypothetical protein
MSTVDDVYRKFGETSESAQLLETELSNPLLLIGAVAADRFEKPDPKRASNLYRKINAKLPNSCFGTHAGRPIHLLIETEHRDGAFIVKGISGYCGSPTRRRSSAKRGSERKGSKIGSTLSSINLGERSS